MRSGRLLKLKVWHSNQKSKLEATDLHGLTGVGHHLLTGQGHHWGLEETLILLPLPSYPAAVKLLYCKRGSGTQKTKLVIEIHPSQDTVELCQMSFSIQQDNVFQPLAWKHRGLDQGGGAAHWAWGIFTKARLEFFVSGRFSFSLHFLLPFYPPFPFKPCVKDVSTKEE